MKKVLSVILALMMSASTLTAVYAAEGDGKKDVGPHEHKLMDMANMSCHYSECTICGELFNVGDHTFKDGKCTVCGHPEMINPFEDVKKDAWYHDEIVAAVYTGIINGKSETIFDPDDLLTYAEAVKLAACMSQVYLNGEVTLTLGTPWYQPYADYCKINNIITKDYAYNLKATVNGKEAKVSKAFEYQRWAMAVVSYTFPEVKEHKEITRVDVSDIIEPKIGRQSIARPHYLKYSEGVEGYDATWYENYQSTGAAFVRPFTGVFAAEKTYTFEVVLEAKDGYAFARKSTGLPDVVVTFNGAVVGYSSRLDGAGRLVVLEEYDYLGSAKEKIMGIVTYQIQEPVIGEKPSFKAENKREDGLYYIDTVNPNSTKNGITWYEGVGGARKMDENDTFKAGEYYYVAIKVKPIEGYQFDTDSNGDLLVRGAINGNMSVIGGNEDGLFIGYTLEKLEEITVTEPEKEPEKPTETEKPTQTEKPEETDKPVEKPTQTEKPQETPMMSFVDIVKGQYYYDAVMWAANEGLTGGTSANTFSPNTNCSRAQVVTFLHRMIGSPEPAAITLPFVDVKTSDYFYKPVKWAFGSKITGGTSATTFSPDSNCSRAQVVTFLWRTTGQPEAKSSKCNFTDIKSDSYYYKAVLWAVEQGITGGTSATTFSPEDSCTRGQVVTFLYRFINGQ